jgi:hypothetical protein
VRALATPLARFRAVCALFVRSAFFARSAFIEVVISTAVRGLANLRPLHLDPVRGLAIFDRVGWCFEKMRFSSLLVCARLCCRTPPTGEGGCAAGSLRCWLAALLARCAAGSLRSPPTALSKLGPARPSSRLSAGIWPAQVPDVPGQGVAQICGGHKLPLPRWARMCRAERGD